jgi:hypothetical protein
MENQVAINIKYFAIGNGNDGYYGEDELYEFKNQIHSEYISSFKVNTAECGANNFFIDFIYNLSLSDFLSFIVGGMAWDIIKHGTKKYAIDKFISFYTNFRTKTASQDIRDVTFLFNDSQVNFYSIIDNKPEVDFNLIGKIFKSLSEHYPNMKNNNKFPTEICIPIFCDSNRFEKPIYRVKLECDEPLTYPDHRIFKESDYWGFWGLKYGYEFKRDVYSVSDKKLLNSDWLTEEEFNKIMDDNDGYLRRLNNL